MALKDVDHIFETFLNLQRSNGWEPLGQLDKTTKIAQLSAADLTSACYVRIERDCCIALEHLINMTRLEMASAGRNVPWMKYKVRALQILSPGDTIFEASVDTDKKNLKTAIRLIAGIFSASPGPTLMRRVVRRDYPSDGMFTVCCIPMGSSNGNLIVSGTHSRNAICRQLKVSEMGVEITTVTTFLQFPWPSLPVWVLPLLRVALIYQKGYIDFSQLGSLNAARQVFMTCKLRSCGSGRPMLPTRMASCTADSSSINCSWAPAPAEGFTFPVYLSAFFRAIGLAVRVFDCLDGRRLVPYQAVLLTDEWENVCATFEKYFAAQKTAFRRFYGRNACAKIYFFTEPRFLDGHVSAVSPDVQIASKNGSVDVIELSSVKSSLKSFRKLGLAAEYH